MKRSCEDLGLSQARTPALRFSKNSRATDVAGAMALVALAFFLAGWLL